MTLLDPDAGEILDRLSILARKRLEKPDRAHFEAEERKLNERFWETVVFAPRHLPALLRLAAVNAALWECENEIRRLREAEDGHCIPSYRMRELGLAAIDLQSRNEERSRLIQFFNAGLGRGAVEEKDFKL